MSRAEILYLFPYVASLAISSGVLYYTWKRRRAQGAKIFVWLVAGRTLAIFGFILELLSPELSGKIFWDTFQWLAGIIELVAFPVFAVQYTGSKVKYPRRSFALSLVVPALLTLAVMTDSLHHLIYPNPHLVSGSPFPELLYDFTGLVVAYALYGYAIIAWSVGILARRLVQPHNLYRVQTAIVIFGFLMPILGTVFTLLGIRIAPQRDSAPFTGALGSLVIAWGLFRYQLFKIVPIAREKVVENIADPVMVLDAQNRVVDINQAALQNIRKKSSEVIGLPAEIVLSEWMELVERFRNVSEERLEITVQVLEETRSYDLSIAPIYDHKERLVGRIFVAHDITRRKNLEDNYRSLSEELEQRVRERTEELRKSAERYRAVVENQTEFIVRWRTDGTRTFVNEAYCRYWGITYEQALAINFRSHIAEADRTAVEEKIVRLLLGEADSETEIHRVIKPDGSIAWQEWTDHTIRDATGQIVEFQSVGRDITERMQAEEALRESEKRFATLSTATFEAIGFSAEGKIIDVNEQMLTMFGYKRDEIIGMNVEQLVAPESLDLVKHQRSLNLEDPYEHIAVKKNGTLFPVEVRPRMIPYRGRFLRVTAIRDMTERKQAEEALRKSEERFSKAFRASPVIVVITRFRDAVFLEVNETFEQVTGYTREEVLGRSTLELGLWVSTADRDRVLATLLANGVFRNQEIQFRMKDGRIMTALGSGELIELEGEKCILATIQDISERKIAEARILRLNRLYVTISQINQAIVHAHDKETLFRTICQVAIDPGQFRMAWIGLLDDAHIRPFVFAGEEQGYLTNLNLDSRDEVQGRGLTETAIREGRCIICQDIANDPRMIPWRDHALLRGYRSSAAVPIRERGCVIGALTVYASELNGFDAEDESLLEQIGLDVSFALDSIEAEHQRQIAEKNLAISYDTTLEGWARALELRDKETEGHSRRVTEATLIVARAMGFDQDALVHVRRGSTLHDIGKMGIPDDILRKNGPLTKEERAIVEKHPDTARGLLRSIPFLAEALEIPYSHHEKWDGSGYPRGLKGEEIPLSARIFAVVDVWDALSSDRSYRSAWPRERVIEYLIHGSGKHFDPKVVEIFLQLLREGKI